MIFFVALIINISRVITELLFVDPKMLRAYQRMMGEWRRRAREAIKSGNPKLIERVKREKSKVDGIGLAVSKMRFKSLIIVSAITIPLIFLYVIPYRTEQIFIPMFQRTISAIWYFMLISFALSAIASIVLKCKGYP